jgi:hypothetical protein
VLYICQEYFTVYKYYKYLHKCSIGVTANVTIASCFRHICFTILPIKMFWLTNITKKLQHKTEKRKPLWNGVLYCTIPFDRNGEHWKDLKFNYKLSQMLVLFKGPGPRKNLSQVALLKGRNRAYIGWNPALTSGLVLNEHWPADCTTDTLHTVHSVSYQRTRTI